MCVLANDAGLGRACLTRPGAPKGSDVRYPGGRQGHHRPYSPYTCLPAEPLEPGGAHTLQLSPLCSVSQERLGGALEKGLLEGQRSEIWSKDWYGVGLFILAILLCSGSVSTKAKANHSRQPHACLTTESRLVCGSHGHRPGSRSRPPHWPSCRDRTFMRPLNLLSKGPLTSCTRDSDCRAGRKKPRDKGERETWAEQLLGKGQWLDRLH